MSPDEQNEALRAWWAETRRTFPGASEEPIGHLSGLDLWKKLVVADVIGRAFQAEIEAGAKGRDQTTSWRPSGSDRGSPPTRP